MAMKEMPARSGFTTALLPLPDFTWKKYRVSGGSPKLRQAMIEANWKNDCAKILKTVIWQ